MPNAEDVLRARMREALGVTRRDDVEVHGPATLASAYPVSEFAAASVATAAEALASLHEALELPGQPSVVTRPVVDAWFAAAVSGTGWSPPPPWDVIAGDYRGADGWIRLHTNAPHHRAVAVRVLGVPVERVAVANAVARWSTGELESAIVAAGGCAAELRSPAEWAEHPQGRAITGLPLIALAPRADGPRSATWRPDPDRPLAGLRVLDLTRVLAGPAATRLLAGLGANVLRIDPPDWHEPAIEPEMTLGKRCARLDARTPEGREQLAALVGEADVLVHGYRPGALSHLGLAPDELDRRRPGLVEVSLSAYGWEGPWADRRGFDSLVQMSTGIAAAGLVDGTAEGPTPLPVQALDHATGYLMAAAVLVGLRDRVTESRGSRAVLSLARTALELERARGDERLMVEPRPELPSMRLETAWGPASLLVPPLTTTDGRPVLRWDRPPAPLGSAPAQW